MQAASGEPGIRIWGGKQSKLAAESGQLQSGLVDPQRAAGTPLRSDKPGHSKRAAPD